MSGWISRPFAEDLGWRCDDSDVLAYEVSARIGNTWANERFSRTIVETGGTDFWHLLQDVLLHRLCVDTPDGVHWQFGEMVCG